MTTIEIIGWSVVAFIFIFVLWQIYLMWEASCYDKPTPKPEHVDTLFRAKQCGNCRHSEISTVYPELACPVLGKHVEPHHRCEEWA